VNLWQRWRFQKGDSDNGEEGFCSLGEKIFLKKNKLKSWKLE
jgi:hypothetical protein